MASIFTSLHVRTQALASGILAGCLLLTPGVANAELSASQSLHSATSETALSLSCDSGGFVDQISHHTPRGVYGAGWIRCNYRPPWLGHFVRVKLTMDGKEVALAARKCYTKGCYAGTDTVTDSAGVQRWCAHIRVSPTGPTQEYTYCKNY